MRITVIFVASVLVALATPPAASAADLRIVAPPQPPPEDVGVTIGVVGAIDGAAAGVRVIAKARPTVGIPCGPAPLTDPGERFLDDAIGSISFELDAEFVPARPGDHLVCAWVVGGTGQVQYGPVSAIVPVRGPGLDVNFELPRTIRPGQLVDIPIEYYTEAPRRLAVFMARGTSCDVPVDPIELLPDLAVFQDIIDIDIRPGTGSFIGAARPERWGDWIVCGFLYDSFADASPPSGFARTTPVRVGGPSRRCARVGGRRDITRVAVGGISCARGRSVARRWGAARRAPRTISGLRCQRGSGRTVRCSGDQGQVTFGYRR